MDITQRLIICGLEEACNHIESGNIGAVVTVINEGDLRAKAFGDKLIASASIAQMPHRIHDIFAVKATPEELAVALQDTTALCERDDDKRIIIHCEQGKGRSFTWATIVANLQMGGADVLDQTLGALHVNRPQGVPLIHAWHFNLFYGKQCKDVRKTLEEFISTGKEKEKLLNTFWRFSDPDNEQILNLSGLSEAEREPLIEQLKVYNEGARRFNMHFTITGA